MKAGGATQGHDGDVTNTTILTAVGTTFASLREPTGPLVKVRQDAIKAQIGLLTAVYMEAGEVAPSFTGQAIKSESAATSADTKNADLKKFGRVR